MQRTTNVPVRRSVLGALLSKTVKKALNVVGVLKMMQPCPFCPISFGTFPTTQNLVVTIYFALISLLSVLRLIPVIFSNKSNRSAINGNIGILIKKLFSMFT